MMAAAGAGAALSPAPVGTASYGIGEVVPASGIVAPAAHKPGTLVIDRSSDGFFYMPAKINGSDVRFLIDTGASMMILPHDVAVGAGIKSNSRATATTVGGLQSVELASIRSVQAAGMNFHHVPAAIQHTGMTTPLLGMDTLAKIGRIEIEGDLLTINPSSTPAID